MPRLVYEPLRGVTDYIEAPCSAVLEAVAGGEPVIGLDEERDATLLLDKGDLIVCIDHVDMGTIGCWPVDNLADALDYCCGDFVEARMLVEHGVVVQDLRGLLERAALGYCSPWDTACLVARQLLIEECRGVDSG